ncbi:hypothetical protein DHEL01_v205644 [Diaporthe helianthi]|uniref:2EXR domain-containing protein n=1 Tax=Diaporthe helianthi TaxID=158607 RepID=A0A2P5I0J3_DIAHE|nr:hypothetical protein DHEL01_v205644 [Diaporthe helianthi]
MARIRRWLCCGAPLRRQPRQPNISDSVPASTMPRFMDFPFEIKEQIWSYALPKQQLLVNRDINQTHLIPTILYVPAVAQVCRESRDLARSRNHSRTLPGQAGLPVYRQPRRSSPSSPGSREPIPACWTWFSPRTDILMIRPIAFGGGPHAANHVLTRAAEHIIVQDVDFWEGLREDSPESFPYQDYEHTAALLFNMIKWVYSVYTSPPSESENHARARGSICSLRTVDFCMRGATKVDPRSPRQVLDPLFGGDKFRVVDLSNDAETAETLRALDYELPQGLDLDPDLFFNYSSHIRKAQDTYKYIADRLFEHVGPVMLTALVSACFEASKKESSEGHGTLPRPFKSGGYDIDMDVAWVKELSERLTVRPVHVYVLGDEMSDD